MGTKFFKILRHLKFLNFVTTPKCWSRSEKFFEYGVANCSEKWSFSAFGRLTNFLKFTLGKDKMKALAFFFIKNDWKMFLSKKW